MKGSEMRMVGMLRIDLKYIFGNYFGRDNFSKDIE
jgi:hypothetical protein